ncbi:MAG: hypothetical protein C0417_03655 [Chlorobiaceae bacterium]|nr:hypothetical protein [Chlorobiaceae bacterium]
MLRYILWVLLLYFGWKIAQAFFRMNTRTTRKSEDDVKFQHLEEAQFEDITDEAHSDEIPNKEPKPTDEQSPK